MRLQIILLIIIAGSGCTSSKRPERPDFSKGSGETSYNGLPSKLPSPMPDANGNQTTDFDVVSARSTIRLVAFKALFSKFTYVTGLDAESPAAKKAQAISHSMGDYDFGSGIQPENKWNSEKMSAWFDVADLACQTPALQMKLQAVDGGKTFIETAYGRDINATETDILATLAANKDLSPEKKARILCISVLQSAEFLSL